MDTQEMIDLCKRHTLFNWAPRDKVEPLPIERAEGIYLYQPDGARIPDLDDVLGWGGGKGVGGLSGDRLPAAWGARSADMCARMPQK